MGILLSVQQYDNDNLVQLVFKGLMAHFLRDLHVFELKGLILLCNDKKLFLHAQVDENTLKYV